MSVCTGERVVTERSDQVQPPRRGVHISHVTLTRLAALSSHKQSAVCILVQLLRTALTVCTSELASSRDCNSAEANDSTMPRRAVSRLATI